MIAEYIDIYLYQIKVIDKDTEKYLDDIYCELYQNAYKIFKSLVDKYHNDLSKRIIIELYDIDECKTIDSYDTDFDRL